MDESEPPQAFHIPSNPYATAYSSTWSVPGSGILEEEDIELLRHVNCSYLSSGRAPTLLALKQHAQSLTNLIRKLTPSNTSVAVNHQNDWDSKLRFWEDEAFDWLGDLDGPYENDDESHHIPLWAVANTVKGQSEVDGIEHHCPLARFADDGPTAEPGATRRPFMTHHNLVMHANECLEILDHEYSATGGLMSLLPPDLPPDDGPIDDHTQHLSDAELDGARNTLLGQWLLHHQHLVGRMHELEISYANALDLLASEAHVPLQLMRRSGTDGISGGREIAYPQDKFVLVNAGDDVTGLIHRLLDRAEAQVEQKEKIWKDSGVSGERMWRENRGGKWYARGIVPIDLTTRFYRIKGKGNQSPLFVIPAVEQHPGVVHTRRIEKRPTVVSVVTPTWPERVTELEAKYKGRMEEAKQHDLENQALVREKLELRAQAAVKDAELRRKTDELAFYEQRQGQDQVQRERALLDEIAAIKARVEQLKGVLPERYHQVVEVSVLGGGQ
ncbi:hypothetical protein ACJ41O_011145 [Fusarium nematophilum]